MPSETVENYLKAILLLDMKSARHSVSTGEIAAALSVSPVSLGNGLNIRLNLLPHNRVQVQDEVATEVCFRNWMELLGWDDVCLCMTNRKGQS